MKESMMFIFRWDMLTNLEGTLLLHLQEVGKKNPY